MDKLITRLQHWTFVVNGTCDILLNPPNNTPVTDQPAELRRQLEVLGSFRWRLEQRARFAFDVSRFTLTPALMHELRSLPRDLPSDSVTLRGCKWLPTDQCDYTQLLASIPTCYSVVTLHSPQPDYLYMLREEQHDYTTEHVLAVCRGAPARGTQAEPCVLRCVCADPDSYLQHGRVEACVRRCGLGPFLAKVVWEDMYHRSIRYESDSESDHNHVCSDEFEYLYAEYLAECCMSPEPSESESEPRSEDRYERRYARMSPTWSDEGSCESDD